MLFTKLIFTFYLIDNFQEYTTIRLLSSIMHGYKFDFAVSALVTLIITLFDFNKKLLISLTTVFLIVIFLTQISDIMYFYESSRHIGYEVSDALTDATELTMTAFSQHTNLSIFSFLFIIFLIIFIQKWGNNKLIQIKPNRYTILKKFIFILISLFFVRGMLQNIPLNPWQSAQIGDIKLASLSLNGTYNAVYALANKSKKLKPITIPNITKEETKKAFFDLYKKDGEPFKALLDKPNIVFLFQESWSAVNMHSYGFEKSTTPFYDEILKKSVRPKAMLAGGHRTTEGIFSTLSSFQNPLGRSIAKTQLQDNQYPSIINILTKRDNYSSAFFQGSSKETSGTGSFVQTLGFKDSYGKRDIKDRIYKENYWGVHDPDLYNFAIEKIDKLTKPFVIGINGATTHDDKIPNNIQKQTFTENENLNNQLNALHFSDFALKNFVEDIQRKYPNTLFVIFADHCGGVTGSSFENYLIPFALYHKDLNPLKIDHFISQRDIAPSIIDLIYGNKDKISPNSSGKSIFSDEQFFADYYHNGVLGWIENDKILEINIITNQKECYKIENFKDIKIKCTNDILEFEHKALAFTNISQKLVFNGKVNNFKEYKNGK